MIRKRFLPLRGARILAWTAVALAWGAATLGRAVVPDGEQDPAPVDAPVEVPAAIPTRVLPAAPDEGLIVLRYAPAPEPEPVVVQRVVTRQAPAPSNVAQSSGS